MTIFFVKLSSQLLVTPLLLLLPLEKLYTLVLAWNQLHVDQFLLFRDAASVSDLVPILLSWQCFPPLFLHAEILLFLSWFCLQMKRKKYYILACTLDTFNSIFNKMINIQNFADITIVDKLMLDLVPVHGSWQCFCFSSSWRKFYNSFVHFGLV